MIGNRSVVRAVAYVIVGCALLAVLIRRLVLVVTVRGASMEPTYRDGDRLLSVRTVLRRMLRPGRVVVGRFAPTETFTSNAPSASVRVASNWSSSRWQGRCVTVCSMPGTKAAGFAGISTTVRSSSGATTRRAPTR